LNNTRTAPEFREESERILAKFRQDCHTAFLKEARTPGMIHLFYLVRCILLNKNLDAKKRVIDNYKHIGEHIKSRMEQIFQNQISSNKELQILLRESIAIEEEILEFLPPDREYLIAEYDEITNHICDVIREEAFLSGLCEGVQMERNFLEREEKEL
jgi:hypothetical protein